MRLGFDEVVTPHVIATLRPQPDTRAVIEPKTASWLVFLGNLQPLTAPDALHPVRAGIPSSISNQRCDPAVAIAAILGGQRYDRPCQRDFVCTDDRRVTLCPTRLADEPVRRDVPRACTSLEPVRLPAGAVRGLQVSRGDILQHLFLKREVGDQTFERSIFLF